MVVMMTPEDKRAIVQRARGLDMTPSELLRRAGRTYDAAEDEAALNVLAEALEQSNAELRQQLDDVMERVDARLAEIARMRAERQAASEAG